MDISRSRARARSLPDRLLVAALIGLACACGGDDDGGDAEDGDAGDGPGADTGDALAIDDDFAPGVPREYVFAIIGDSGDTDPSDPDDPTNAGKVAALVERFEPDFIVSAGDQDYTDGEFEGSFEGLELGIGQYYHAYIGDYAGSHGAGASENRFFPVPGDHDYGDDCDNPRLGDYLDYFSLPTGPEDETYYELRRGPIHFFFLDSIVDCHGDDGEKLARQQAWVETRATESDAGLLVAVFHHPPYSSGESHGSAEHMQWPWAAWGFDLIISGDDHIYERIELDGVTYIVNGLGGVERHDVGSAVEGSVVRYSAQFGAARAEVFERGMHVSFIALDGETIDSFTLGEIDLEATSTGGDGDWYRPGVDTTWQWQLLGEVNASYDVDVYDIDLFDNPTSVIETLQADGRRVLCYFSAGSYEDWRPDADDFPADALGDPLDGFEDERWLDVRAPEVLAIMEARMDLAVEKGCDGVEPDNVDGYANDSGFDLGAADQRAFNLALAEAAHARGLAVALKNDLDQIPELVDAFDMSVNEQCHEYDECALLVPFIEAGKPVFNAEYLERYVDDSSTLCDEARAQGLRTLVLPLDLDDSLRISCD